MLKNYYIGDTVEYLSVEYAKSGRSSCKTCKQKIGQDQLRIGILFDDDHFSTGQGTQWFHKNCFHLKSRHKVLQANELNKKIYNFESLQKKDQKDVLAYLKQQLITIKEGKPKKKVEQKSKPKPAVSKSKSKSKVQEKKPAPKEAQKQQQKRVNTRSRSQLPKKIELEPEVKPEQKKKKAPKAKKQAPKKFLTPAQTKEYKQLLEEYNKLSVNELKDILQKNAQAKTGTKGDLATKCADGKQFGRIPMCHKCGGGKLRFNRETGTYTCPGYMQDTDFVNCGVKLKFDDVKRLEWNE